MVNDNIQVHYAKGCDLVTDDRSGFKKAIEAARKSDISIIFVGSSSASLARDYIDVTSGEGFDLTSLKLPGVQDELIKSIKQVGKPVVLILVTGKPFAIPWAKQHISSIFVQWYGGERSGDAIADMIFGKTNPSAKLPFSFPKSVGHLPVYYNYLPTDKGYYHQPGSPNHPGRDYVFSSPAPLWAFGYGLSYTSFKYVNVTLSGKKLLPTDTLKVSVKIHNNGSMDGKEVVQLYVRDLTSSVVTPIKQLKNFAKPSIKAGKTTSVSMKLPITELSLYNSRMKKVVEPGNFEIQIGSASDNIKFKKIITVVDPFKGQTEKTNNNPETTKKVEKQNETLQKTIKISGTVRDVQSTPIDDVKVKSIKFGKESITNSKGKYIIQAFVDDILSFSISGYEEATINVESKKNINVRLNRSNN